MKDLYTFDWTEVAAKQTYEAVKTAYSAFFDELKLPYSVADASSGAMGGKLSHEYHVTSEKGEDRVINCATCGYTANEEVAERSDESSEPIVAMSPDSLLSLEELPCSKADGKSAIHKQFFLTTDHRTLVQAVVPRDGDAEAWSRVDPKLMKLLFTVDTSIENPKDLFLDHAKTVSNTANQAKHLRIICVLDRRISFTECSQKTMQMAGTSIQVEVHKPGLELTMIKAGDKCPNEECSSGTLQIRKCIELGHTFHLGTRYSEPLDAKVAGPSAHAQSDHGKAKSNYSLQPNIPSPNSPKIPVHMGCHGIGISRLIAAVADINKDEKGLNWPRAMAPFEAVIIPTVGREHEASEVYDLLNEGANGVDCIIDDREHGFGYKMRDAELIGYPIIVRVGKLWDEDSRKCLVQCRRAGGYERDVAAQDLKGEILGLLDKL